MRIDTRYFGQLEFDEASVLDFPAGMPGFENEKQFVVIEVAQSRPLVFLQSVCTASLCWIAVPVQSVTGDYRARLSAEDREVLQVDVEVVSPSSKTMILAIISDGAQATANLLAPIVVHLPLRLAAQVIQYDSGYSHRQEIGPVEGGEPCS